MRIEIRSCWLLALVLFFASSAAWAASEIKIGLMYSTSGVYAGPSKQGIQGAKLAFDEVGNQIGGHKVKLIVEDVEAKPAVALAKAKMLVESDHVQALMGLIWSPNAMAIRNYINAAKVPLVISEAAVRPITQEASSPYIYRTGFSAGQLTYPFGKYACGKLGYHRIVLISFDSVFGRELGQYFDNGCRESGGSVVAKIFAPVQTADFAPYFARIQAANPDAVWALWSGSAALRFLKQYSNFGMKKKYPLIAFGATTDQFVINAAGPVADGIISYYDYSVAIDSPANNRFVKEYHRHFGQDPGVFSEGGYRAARAIIEAAKVVHGDFSDTGKFLAALQRVHFMAPSGEIRFDSHHQTIHNLYIRKVVRRADGKFENKPIDVIKNLEQYWPKGKPAK